MRALSFSANNCHDFNSALSQEWVVRNKLGGTCSSTILCAHTKREHGLLVTRLKKPLGDFVMLSNVDELLYIDDRPYPLSTRIHSSGIFPAGYQFIYQVSLEPFPTWIYHIEDLILEKNIIFLKKEQTVIVRYQILSGDEDLVKLEFKPLTAFRRVHDLTRANGSMSSKLERSGQKIKYAGIYFYHNAAILDQSPSWFQNVHYSEDMKRGADFEEDLYAPFCLVYAFGERRENFFTASLVDRKPEDISKLLYGNLVDY